MREEEHNIQAACVRWFNFQWPQYRGLLFAVPNGGARSKATAGKLKAEGVVPGVADLVRIDKRTVVMVKASKWTPDYAERYRAKMEASKPQHRWTGDQCMRMWNDTIKEPKPKKKKK